MSKELMSTVSEKVRFKTALSISRVYDNRSGLVMSGLTRRA